PTPAAGPKLPHKPRSQLPEAGSNTPQNPTMQLPIYPGWCHERHGKNKIFLKLCHKLHLQIKII
uniref:hypothetical protein n=1 Tax=Eisenbergiella sp. TaxID=1924109 RepID=UPI003AB5A266